jgi:hypothetical protein
MQENKIIICKFNLKNKCYFGKKCRFHHLNLKELSEIIVLMEDLKSENKSLKTELKEKAMELSNLKKKSCDVKRDAVHALEKPLYSSFFNQEIKYSNDTKTNARCPREKKENNSDSGIDDDSNYNDRVELNKLKSKPKTKKQQEFFSFNNGNVAQKQRERLMAIHKKQIEQEKGIDRLEYQNIYEHVISSNNNLSVDQVKGICQEMLIPINMNVSVLQNTLEKHTIDLALHQKAISKINNRVESIEISVDEVKSNVKELGTRLEINTEELKNEMASNSNNVVDQLKNFMINFSNTKITPNLSQVNQVISSTPTQTFVSSATPNTFSFGLNVTPTTALISPVSNNKSPAASSTESKSDTARTVD